MTSAAISPIASNGLGALMIGVDGPPGRQSQRPEPSAPQNVYWLRSHILFHGTRIRWMPPPFHRPSFVP
jgi:hypothetical protein